ncbi:uncharacterized protein LOC133422444 [Cololabis saira]|uniref:uncharacterized protein LOC133422444 n=1 Tax=Cololabis saira TaxID=129043 RepID=UPI002AD4AA5D|nr:uncharacterized protein LOC133422444 [Cololabis saira]XP_061568424.1 uncharacterized protein LOC133422444 [Cololabis saira]
MEWKCKLCSVTSNTRRQLFQHYTVLHSQYSTVSRLPCLYASCICTFPSFNAMKAHMSRSHREYSRVDAATEGARGFFACPLCDFKHPFSEEILFGHLRSHLRRDEMVACPFKNCKFGTNVYSTFNAHKSRNHGRDSDFGECVVLEDNASAPVAVTAESLEEPAGCESAESADTFDLDEVNSGCDTDNLRAQLNHDLASLFLKMQSILHVSDMASQQIAEHLSQIFSLSQPILKHDIREVLQRHDITVGKTVLNEVVGAVMDSNVVVSATAKGKPLSSAKRRKTFIENNYPVVKPVQHVLAPGHTAVHVSVLEMIQKIFNHTDVLDKMKETKVAQNGHYKSHQDGSYFKENPFLSSDELKIPLILYIDDLEIANPLGTSQKIHKICSVYWMLADLPSKYRSALHVIQLAAVCKVADIKTFGFEKALGPLLRDLRTLEQDGVFIGSIGQVVQGTVMCVVSDNLAAHDLAGFSKSFRAEHFCRFCTATQAGLQAHEVASGEFSLRTKDGHSSDVHAVMHGGSQSQNGVTADCVLSQHLEHFHTVTGFPPDVLHDLFEGIVPVELALCIGEMIRRKYFTLEYLNDRMMSFPYQRTDKVDKPHKIPETFAVRKSIGGNGHENATLLRLLPLIIGNAVPEEDGAWTVLMELKEVVELSLCTEFTEESIQYLQSKIQDHREKLKEAFPDFTLRPKHHYIEHYPDLVRRFGPLVHLWTMRFEGKHRFFKRVVHDTQNFKNVLKTLANKHQYMVAYHLSTSGFFKPHQQTSTVSSVLVTSLPNVAKTYIEQITASNVVYSTSKVCIDGTDYDVGMFLSVGQKGGLPNFCRIEQVLLVNGSVLFLCREHTSNYIEHLRSYELSPENLAVHTPSELNDTTPLCAYNVDGRLLLTPKRFILLH